MASSREGPGENQCSETDLGSMAILLDSPCSKTPKNGLAPVSPLSSPQSHGAPSGGPPVDSGESAIRGENPCVVAEQPRAVSHIRHRGVVAAGTADLSGSGDSNNTSSSAHKDTDWFWRWNTAPSRPSATQTSPPPVTEQPVPPSATSPRAKNGADVPDGRRRASSTPVPTIELASSASKRLSFSPPPNLSSETVPGQPEHMVRALSAGDGSNQHLPQPSSSMSDREGERSSSSTPSGGDVYPPLQPASMSASYPTQVMVPISGVLETAVRTTAAATAAAGPTNGASSALRHSTPDIDAMQRGTAPIPSSVFAEFAKGCQCSVLMPDNSKMVIFDAHLLVKKAFYALVQNGVRSAPVWDSVSQSFIGMLTITDFINILRHYYRSPLVQMHELEEHRIQTWRDLAIRRCHEVLVSIDPLQSIYEAIRMLVEKKIHRLPVIDPRSANCLYILTPKRLLQFIYLEFENVPQPEFMSRSISFLNIGTYNNIATVSQDTALIVILNIFSERRISAVPVIDHNGQVVEVYAKFDVINLAAEKTYNNLDISVKDALKYRAEDSRSVHTCLLSESLSTVIRRIVEKQVHRLVVVDGHNHVVGIVSLSDILSFLVLKAPDLFA